MFPATLWDVVSVGFRGKKPSVFGCGVRSHWFAPDFGVFLQILVRNRGRKWPFFRSAHRFFSVFFVFFERSMSESYFLPFFRTPPKQIWGGLGPIYHHLNNPPSSFPSRCGRSSLKSTFWHRPSTLLFWRFLMFPGPPPSKFGFRVSEISLFFDPPP